MLPRRTGWSTGCTTGWPSCVVPVFSFPNAGSPSLASTAEALLGNFTLGLLLGARETVLGSAWADHPPGPRLPAHGASLAQCCGISLLCGIGFTMSLFIGMLAFKRPGTPGGGEDRHSWRLAAGGAGRIAILRVVAPRQVPICRRPTRDRAPPELSWRVGIPGAGCLVDQHLRNIRNCRRSACRPARSAKAECTLSTFRKSGAPSRMAARGASQPWTGCGLYAWQSALDRDQAAQPAEEHRSCITLWARIC